MPIYLTTSPWLLHPPKIRYDITKLPKSNNIVFRKHILELIAEFPNFILCVTDGSKINQRTAYAYSINNHIHSARIRNSATVYSAELNAILACLSHLSVMPPNNYLLLTDSLSSLKSLQDPFSTNPLIQRIQLFLDSLHSIKSCVIFVWIPGHIGLPQHDLVDQAAKQATSLPKITDPILSPASDLKIFYRTLIQKLWSQNWENQLENKLRKIKNYPSPWSTSYRSNRREEIILARLRIGHTRLTHSFLLLNLFSPPSCPHCGEENLSVQHFFSCPSLHQIRSSLSVPSTVASALSNNFDIVLNTLSYLRNSLYYPLL